jgi:transposase
MTPMIDQADLTLIIELFEQGLSITAIARRVSHDRKTVRKYIASRDLPARQARVIHRPNKLDRFVDYLTQRIGRYPDLTAARLLREIRSMGYDGSATALCSRVRDLKAQSMPMLDGFQNLPRHLMRPG